MTVLENTALAVLVFAVLYGISRVLENWPSRLTRQGRAPDAGDPPELLQSRIPTAKFGTHFKHN